MSMVGKKYRTRMPGFWPSQPAPACFVEVLAQWSGKGPRNVLVELRPDFGRHDRWVRPARGMRRIG
jgi:hypothetical protein